MPFPVIGGSDHFRSTPSDAQTTINLYAEFDKDARGKGVLYGIPGLTLFGEVGSGPIRGCQVMAGVAYVVSGNGLYQLLSDGTSGLLGAIGGTGPVGMANDGVRMLLVNGSQGYVYTTGTGLTTITDADFLQSYTCGYISGYFIVAGGGTTTWATSALNDPTTWNALDRGTVDVTAGNIQAVIPFNGEVHVFLSNSRTVWYDAANPTALPFSQNVGATINLGCLAKYSVAADMTAVYWLGSDGVVYRASSYSPEPISDPAMNYEISITTNPQDAIGFVFQDTGHYFYCLSFPDGKTWVYDITTKLWHQRQSYGIDRWRAQWPITAYGKTLWGDYISGNVGYTGYGVFTEYGDPLRWERTMAPLAQGGRLIFLDRFEIVMESGVGVGAVNPVINLEYSTDGGRTFCDPIEANYGAVGQYRWRTFWCGLGSGENFDLRIWSADPYTRNIVDGSISFDLGAQ